MQTQKFLSRLKRLWASPQQHKTQGFTLLELLVVTVIASGIVAGLMFIVVQLMTTDQREASRSETQREMQMALDYISTDLREAVYVYTGNQLANVQAGGVSRGAFSNFLPTSLSDNSTPILAFWKQQRFPRAIQDRCARNVSTTGINCEVGSSYALVIYSLSTANANNIWSANNARITRYVLSEFNNAGNYNAGYVNPGSFGNFASWPFGRARGNAGIVNLQTVAIYQNDTRIGRPTGSPVPLVDFVDTTTPLANNTTLCPTEAGVAYGPSPLTNPVGLFACVSVRPTAGTGAQQIELSGFNQDVILSIKGTVRGRPGYAPGTVVVNYRNNADTLPTLETRVLARGVLGRSPGQ